MPLDKYLNKDVIEIDLDVDTPIDVIRHAGQLLVNANKVKLQYIEDMVNVYQNLGAYIVIAPGIAFPHSKPSEDVNETCVSFCSLKKPMNFGHPMNDPVKFIFALGGKNETDHIEMLRELSEFLMEDSNLTALSKLEDKDEFIQLLKKGGVR